MDILICELILLKKYKIIISEKIYIILTVTWLLNEVITQIVKIRKKY